MKNVLILLILSFMSINALAGTVSGKVNMLETWKSGNVAFTLDTAVTTCNGQFILNYSSNGSKNMYSALLAAKISDKPVKISYAEACGNADNYGSSQYNMPTYIYTLDE